MVTAKVSQSLTYPHQQGSSGTSLKRCGTAFLFHELFILKGKMLNVLVMEIPTSFAIKFSNIDMLHIQELFCWLGGLRWEILSSMWNFSQGLDNVVRKCDKLQIFCKEMTLNGTKANCAKWKLIGGIQIKLVKTCLVFM